MSRPAAPSDAVGDDADPSSLIAARRRLAEANDLRAAGGGGDYTRLRRASLVEIPADDRTTIPRYFSIAATSLLRHIDGNRTGPDIVAAAEHGCGEAAGRKFEAMERLALDTPGELHEHGAIVAA